MNTRINFSKSRKISIGICFLLILSSTTTWAQKSWYARPDQIRLLELPGSLKGKVILQGRDQGKMTASLQVKLYEPGKVQPAFTYHVLSSAEGEFIIENIQAGDYVVTVKNSHTLQVAAPASVIQGQIAFLTFAPLLEGDANDDNQITALDFSILSKAFGTVQGSNKYNSAADFNMDAAISDVDFSLLAGNYNRKGYQVTETSYDELTYGGAISLHPEKPKDKSGKLAIQAFTQKMLAVE